MHKNFLDQILTTGDIVLIVKYAPQLAVIRKIEKNSQNEHRPKVFYMQIDKFAVGGVIKREMRDGYLQYVYDEYGHAVYENEPVWGVRAHKNYTVGTSHIVRVTPDMIAGLYSPEMVEKTLEVQQEIINALHQTGPRKGAARKKTD